MKSLTLILLLLKEVAAQSVGSFTVKGIDCSYHFDTKVNVITVTCGKNATVSVRNKDGAFEISGNGKNYLWFEKGSNVGQTSEIFRPPGKSSSGNKTENSYRATQKLKDATAILRKIKKRLSVRNRKLRNITDILQNGNEVLEQDLQNLTKLNLVSFTRRNGMIAALSNQYRFLSMVMRSQNNEMKAFMSYMGSLISATQKTVRSFTALHEQLQEEILLLNMALVKANISRIEKKTDFCPRTLTGIASDGVSIKVGIAQGTFMRDSIPAGKFWVTYGYTDINVVAEYETLDTFKFDSFTEHKLPFFCEGTGHVVYRNTFYCHKVMTNKIVKYDLLSKRWLGEITLEGAGMHNTYPYESGTFTDIDFAVDELGLWVIYATAISHGNIIISKLDEDDFRIAETWITNIHKPDVGNTFMICGVLYAVDSYKNVPTYVKYVFNTNTGGSKVLGPGNIPFKNTIKGEYAQNYMLDYNPRDRNLYAWNHNVVEVYPTFSDKR